MQFRGVLVATLGLFLGACSSDPPAKKVDSPEVPIVKFAPPPVVQPEKKPVTDPPAPKDKLDAEPTPLAKEKTPTEKNLPKEKEPAEKEPAKTGKDPEVPGKEPKVPAKDPNDTGKEPKFVVPTTVMGRTFDSWKAEIKSKDPTRREKAMKMILNFGGEKAYEALPDIIAELSKHNKPSPIDLSFRVNGVVAMSTIFFNKKDPDEKLVDAALSVYKTSLKDKQVILRTRAVQGVLSLGARSQELIDEIISVAHEPVTGEVRKEGIIALTRVAVDANKKVHPKAPIELRKALDDVSGQVKVAALQGIIAISPAFDAKDKQLTIDRINALLKKKDTDPFLQMLAHVSIMNVTGKVDKANLDPLVAMLKGRDESHRAQALQFLKMFGAKAQIAIGDVIALSTGAEEWAMRKEALITAMQLAFDKNGMHPSLLPALLAALNDKSPDVRQAALNGMIAAKPGLDKNEIKTTVARVNAYLKTEKEPLLEILTHVTIMTLTGDIGQTNMDPIVALIQHKEQAVRLEAFRAIALGGKKSKPFALDAVVKAVRDPDLTIGMAAIETLPSIHAVETMDLLKAIVADKKMDPVIVETAEDTLVLLNDILVLEKNAKDNAKNKAEK